MRLAVLRAPGRFEIEDLPVPEPGPDDLLVAVAACGVCASELEAWTGRSEPDYPLRLGHEVSGTVAAVGERVEGFAVGDPVGVWVTQRGFSEYVVVPASAAFPAGHVPLDTVLAEPLACAVNAVELADVRLGDDVVLIGAGFMGHLAQQLTALRGPRQVIVADTRRDALQRAKALGATRTVHVGEESLRDVVAELTDGRMADVTFECTGSPAALGTLGEVTRMSGKLVLVGFHQGSPRSIPLGYWNWMAYDIRNGHFREVSTILAGMRTGMRLLSAGILDLSAHVTHRFELDDIAEAFDTAVAKPDGFVKATVVVGRRTP
jgi:2-desacetyl-2-hydroxyethyl bacteriochlorophyllide A dehydrogenase